MSKNVSSDGRYTHGHPASTLASHATRSAASSAAYLLPLLRRGMRLLDVGCGPGTITLDLAEAVAPGQVVGIEPVETPLSASRAAASERGDAITQFEVADVMDLPYDDDSFDVVHAHQVLQHLTDPVGALREMRRVCRPGGWIAARDADYAAMSWHPDVPELSEWRALYRAVARANGAEPDAARRLRSWALAAELPEPRVSGSLWVYSDEATCRWWGESQADRYAGEVFAAQAAEQGASADDLARIAQGWRRWGSTPDATFLMPHGELLVQLPG
ncbi:class I SAM-dependent methyltransferase [Nocardioides insulae]|uniref:class I SAM-dependent methyltransferase n=1 Tax=Nocardioides insulae TaxID=394734 RepID=UPI0005656FC4|nr:methyltransferase domain-containing protein [Nocardioides insulae]